MEEVFIVGVGMTAFGKFLERPLRDLVREAIDEALEDCGGERSWIEAAWFANAAQGAIENQHSIRGQVALRPLGFERIPIINVENACASASTAFNQAVASLRAGEQDAVIAVGCEKMYHQEKEKSFAIFQGSLDVEKGLEGYQRLLKLGEGVGPLPDENSGKRSLFMDIYSAMARFHMKTFGTTQRQLAAISSKNHFHSTFNPKSQYRNPLSIEEILGARLISWPFTLPMCSPISDGAAAAVLCNRKGLSRFKPGRSIKVLSSVVGCGVDRKPEEFDKNVGRLAALKAYEKAGIGPKDISLAEVHDATAFAELQQSENLGFCEPGQGGWLAEKGATKLGGRIPINPSGGLESKGHPIGATGLGQIHELVTQLRGEAGARQVPEARFGIAENGGGFYEVEEAVIAITILGRN